MSYLLALTTTSSLQEARKIAQFILTKRFAACVNIVSKVESHYWWKKKLESSRECLLLIKMRKSQYSKLEAAIQKVHSYDTPEIIAVPLSRGSRKYLRWLNQETAVSADKKREL